MLIYDIRPIKQRRTPVKLNGRLVGHLEERPRIINLKNHYKIVVDRQKKADEMYWNYMDEMALKDCLTDLRGCVTKGEFIKQ